MIAEKIARTIIGSVDLEDGTHIEYYHSGHILTAEHRRSYDENFIAAGGGSFPELSREAILQLHRKHPQLPDLCDEEHGEQIDKMLADYERWLASPGIFGETG